MAATLEPSGGNGTRLAAAVADDGRVDAVDEGLARQLAERAQVEGVCLNGPGGLLGRLIKVVLESALEGEMDAHLGYRKDDPVGYGSGYSLAEWQSRPLDAVYAVLFLDAIHVKIRDGQVANRPIYVAVGVTADGERDILGLWAGEHGDGEGAKYWLRVLTEIRNRGTRDVLMVVCDGLNGFPDAIGQVWPAAVTQTCIIHLLRNSFRYSSRQDWATIAKDLKLVYKAATEAEALERFADFAGTWETRYPAVVRLWENAWPELSPFLAFDREIRTIITTTNAIESLNARIRRSVKAHGYFPTEQAALRHFYLVIISLDPTGQGRQRWSNRWKSALNAFDVTFDGRLSVNRN